jgi:hypothetical protein
MVVYLEEPEVPQAFEDQDWEAIDPGMHVSWGSSNDRYDKARIPKLIRSQDHRLTGWRNERLNAQILVWSKDSLEALTVRLTDLESGGGTIARDALRAYFVRNVLADEFLGGCGYKTKSQESAHLVGDCLEEAGSLNMEAKTVRGIWVNIDIPAAAQPGSYTTELRIEASGEPAQTLNLCVEVLERTLPDPARWEYHLDLWQNPFAAARVSEVGLWSEQHFEAMIPLYDMLAAAGQKCITASIVHRPWGGQTLDHFESMVKHTLKADGSWAYDYSIFDNWVNFMMERGITEQINCYSLIPWGNQLWYFDESRGIDTFMVARASSEEFAGYWTPFLEDFASHLKTKGWYDISTIAMDERPAEDMISAIQLIQEHAGLKITSAANYSPGTSEHIFDLSVAPGHLLPEDLLEQRRQKGQYTTYYVCCADEYPNNFTFSPPAEGVWQGWFTFASKHDGFLRWAYNSWVEDPLQDTRFRTWPSGDTFFVYPGPRSSIRWEKLREGIQDYEKLRILTKEWNEAGTDEALQHLQKLEKALQAFKIENIPIDGAEKAVTQGKEVLNDLAAAPVL